MKPEQIAEKLDRKKDSHKGENGKLLIVGGSREYTGAPAIAAKAAYRSGCDLVTIATSSLVRDVIASYSENFIVRSYGKEFRRKAAENIRFSMEWCDAAVIGPGIGEKDPRTITEFAEKFDKPLVSDANAINPVAKSGKADVVYTPHKAELERLKKIMSIEELTNRGSVVLEKSKTDVVHTSEGEYENSTGNPSMTVGGTGDSLAGILGSLLAQGLEPDEAAFLSAYINGKAGEKAAEEYGIGMTATDLIEEIPYVMNSFR